MKLVYLGLGSNLGDRRKMLESAIEKLHGPDLRILRISSVYETEPMGLREQGWFLNLALEAETRLFPLQLLGRLQHIQAELGRRRTVVNGPRVIDIDLLLFAQSVIQSSRLTVPHPRMHERRFVLAPLAELAPDLRHPVLRKRMVELLNEIKGQAISKTETRFPTPAPILQSP